MAPPDPVTIQGLTVVRGPVVAVADVSLRLEPGTITGLLGPSGSGKTTLMRAIVGNQRITAGSVLVAGHLAGSAAVRHRVGYMSQLAALYADLTVEENLAYFARVLGVDAARVQQVIDRIEMGHRRTAMVRTLSGGESNRVSLGVALLGNPDILILDEPTVGLDPLLRRALWDQFRELADAGTTLLVSSHVMEEAERCDRLILMREGAVLFDGARADLSADGASDIEAAFIRLAEGDGR
jgi:ABC-2 type transport system ATP-binding protein